MSDTNISNSIINSSTTQPSIALDSSSKDQMNAGVIATIHLFDSKFTDMDRKFIETERKIERSGDKNIETLALFVGLFTFISIEFSLFKELKDFSQVISLTLITAGLLIFFIFLLHLIVRSASSKNSWTWVIYPVLFLISILLVVGGIFFPKTGIDRLQMENNPPASNPPLLVSPSPTINPKLNQKSPKAG